MIRLGLPLVAGLAGKLDGMWYPNPQDAARMLLLYDAGVTAMLALLLVFTVGPPPRLETADDLGGGAITLHPDTGHIGTPSTGTIVLGPPPGS